MAFAKRLCSLSFPKYLRNITRQDLLNLEFGDIFLSSQRFYSAKKPAALSKSKGGVPAGTAIPKYKLQPVEDAELLVTRLCGGNFMKEGEDPVLKPDSEYPDWLWEMNPGHKPVPLEELSQDSWEYWRRVVKLDKKRKGAELAIKFRRQRFSTPPPVKK